MRRAAHVDESHKPIVAALRAGGASVLSLAAVGKGAPDILIGYAGINVLAELKNAPAKGVEKHRTVLSPEQAKWHADWRGRVVLLRTTDEALALLRLIVEELKRAATA